MLAIAFRRVAPDKGLNAFGLKFWQLDSERLRNVFFARSPWLGKISQHLRASIIRTQGLQIDGPAGLVNPVPLLKVHRIKGQPAGAPAGHRTAEDAITPLIHDDGMADAFALINVLSFVFFAQASGLDETHLQATAKQFLRNRNSRSAGADNTKIY